MKLTAGLPYKKLGSVQLKSELFAAETVPETEEIVTEEVVVDSSEYQIIVDKYTDKNGKLSYELLNKDMIKFAHSSSIVRKMIDAGESVETIRLYTVGTKFRNITGNKDLTDAQILKITDLLDEVSPKGVLKEFNDEIRRLKAR